jgi:protein tyrosine/serine phosphatase
MRNGMRMRDARKMKSDQLEHIRVLLSDRSISNRPILLHSGNGKDHFFPKKSF